MLGAEQVIIINFLILMTANCLSQLSFFLTHFMCSDIEKRNSGPVQLIDFFIEGHISANKSRIVCAKSLDRLLKLLFLSAFETHLTIPGGGGGLLPYLT